MTSSLQIAHYVSLSGFGGVEQHFAAFATRAATRADVHQSAVACSKEVHDHHRKALDVLDDLAFEKKWRGIEIPRRPKGLRRGWARHVARRQGADVALLWNRLAQQARAIDVLGARRALYWEHGSAWLYGGDAEKQRALSLMPAVLANSHSAKRMLELRWGYAGPIRVEPNGVRARLAERPRTLSTDRPLRLGVAGRLIGIKGSCLALHALAALIRQGRAATLAIAGDGPARGRLETLVGELGLSDHVIFRNVVDDMPAFFAEIDVLVHAALREPFGLVAAEAQAAGVPVVCTAVDGLPEVVADRVTGRCVVPTGDLARYEALGGESAGLPPKVYRPETDSISAPRICEPADLAAAIADVVADPARYGRMSEAAIARVRQRFDFETHVDRVLAAVREYAETGTLDV